MQGRGGALLFCASDFKYRRDFPLRNRRPFTGSEPPTFQGSHIPRFLTGKRRESARCRYAETIQRKYHKQYRTFSRRFFRTVGFYIKGFIENLVVFYLENSGHKITLYTKRWFALANHFFLCYNIFRYFSIFGGFLLTLNQYLL